MKKKHTIPILIAVIFLSTLACDTGIRNPTLYEIARRGYLVKGKEEPPPQVIIVPNEDEDMPAQPTEIPQDSETPFVIEIPMADPQQTQLPSEHITYKGNVAGLAVTIDIYYPIEGSNSVMGTVSGPVCGFDGDINGAFNAQALSFTAEFGCLKNSDLSGDSLWEGTITGAPSADFKSISGTLVDGDGQPHEFTFYSQE